MPGVPVPTRGSHTGLAPKSPPVEGNRRKRTATASWVKRLRISERERERGERRRPQREETQREEGRGGGKRAGEVPDEEDYYYEVQWLEIDTVRCSS